MKRYIHDDRYTSNFHFDIVVEIEYFDDTTRVAASEYKGFYVPDGPVISGLPDEVLGSKALQDYADFIESVQALITDFYKLKIYYKNTSKDLSNYFGILAKNKDGSIIIDFDFTLRISNHDAKRSKQSQKHKKEKEAERFIRLFVENKEYSDEQKEFLIRCLERGDSVDFICEYASASFSVEQMAWFRTVIGGR